MKDKVVNLDELQTETEKLLQLLNDRQLGLITWNMFLIERLTAIKKMAEEAGIK